MRFISIYYEVLKANSSEGEQILEMTPIILKKMFKTYAIKSSEGLIFKYLSIYEDNLLDVFPFAPRVV